LHYFIITFSLVIILSGCSLVSKKQPAPVVALKNKPQIIKQRTIHHVKSGDTVYIIAWLYDMDFYDLATFNHLKAPYKIVAGQKLYLKPQHSKAPQAQKPKKQKKPISTTVHAWCWPAQGKMIRANKGIDISGKYGSPIKATAGGKVVYSGSALRGYGKLLIIKHNEQYLSAYAHNSELLAKEGEQIKRGQIIAKMGNTDPRHTKLHFEIRKNGKPINPLSLLPRSPA